MQFISRDLPDHMDTMQAAYEAMRDAMSFAMCNNLMFAGGILDQSDYDASVRAFEEAVVAMRDQLNIVQPLAPRV
jgi:hypothetical protein